MPPNPAELRPVNFTTGEVSSSDERSLVLSPEALAVETKLAEMSFRQCFKAYTPAILFSAIGSSTCIMQGYDLALIGNFYGMIQFNKKYGTSVGVVGGVTLYEIAAGWKLGLNVAALVGEIIGLYLGGLLSQKFGYKKTMIGSLIFMILGSLIPCFAPSVWVLVLGQFICGIPWGIFQTLPTAYAVEIAPAPLRPLLCSAINICWLLGQLMAVGVVMLSKNMEGNLPFRFPFFLMLALPAFILVGVIFSPESPVWLVRQGRENDAKKSLLKLTRRNVEGFDADGIILLLKETNEIEKARSEGTSFFDCFRGMNLRRTEIACGAWMAQSLCGSVLIGLSVLFYQSAGTKYEQALLYTLIQAPIGIVGGILNWFLIAKLPRRALFLGGLGLLCATLVTIGFGSWSDQVEKITSYLFIFWVFVYGCTVGPSSYSIVAEIPSSQLKAPTISLARMAYNSCNIIASALTSFMLTDKKGKGWSWKTKSALFWGGSALLCFIWAYVRVPEQKGVSNIDMEVMFENKERRWNFGKRAKELAERRRLENGEDKTPKEVCRDVGTPLRSLFSHVD
ncbi:related to transporter (major facilitator superfamily) [Rhynchosporium agropyri]|uniref:Related to transporter (Major facilitator superfamily) n=1 Tax=Rhynchosporium agropyri TaxID=914238 RepID=A0A1E1K7E3_9HELO|nr:related to transporter (major facilitator superfamily) [Rhynchosporium agropyri]